MKGKVKFFNTTKGYGFITAEDGKDYFFHHTGIKEGVRINENDDVQFDVEQGERGPKAINIEKASESSEDSSEKSPEEGSQETPEEEKEEA